MNNSIRLLAIGTMLLPTMLWAEAPSYKIFCSIYKGIPSDKTLKCTIHAGTEDGSCTIKRGERSCTWESPVYKGPADKDLTGELAGLSPITIGGDNGIGTYLNFDYTPAQRAELEQTGAYKPLPPATFTDRTLGNYELYMNPFPDLRYYDATEVAAAELYRRGVITGYPDGEFKPELPVTRAETAKFLLLTRYGPIENKVSATAFTDVQTDQWYMPYISKAAALGIISGYPDSTFRPANQVTKAEFSKMMAKTFDLPLNKPTEAIDVEAGSWYEPYVGSAEKYGFSHPMMFEPERVLTRNEVAQFIYEYLANSEIERALNE